MSAIIEKCYPWAETWLHDDLFGGLKGRDPNELHDLMMGAIANANGEGEDFAGAKIDLKKCFDTINADQAIDLWGFLGADPQVCNVLRNFYSRNQRWVESREAVHPHPVQAKRSLLQGCPASPLLLAAMMVTWVIAVKKECPEVNVGVYLDDRTIWATGVKAAALIHKALAAGMRCDKRFGATEHPDKREVFANKAKVRKKLRSLVTDIARCASIFNMLGIRYQCTRGLTAAIKTGKWDEAIRRTKRIGWSSNNVGRKAKLLHSLVLLAFFELLIFD